VETQTQPVRCDRAVESCAADLVGVIVAPAAVKIEGVGEVSAWHKIGVFLRILREQIRRNRTANALLRAVGATLRSFANVVHQLWLEVTGTIFLAMACFGGFALVREYMKYQAGRTTAGRVAIAVAFTLAFGWFGLSSFWRAHRRSKPREQAGR